MERLLRSLLKFILPPSPFSKPKGVRIQMRRDTAENWVNYNPVLLAGEPGYEIDTKRFKIGDGITPWANLPYRDNTWIDTPGMNIGGCPVHIS